MSAYARESFLLARSGAVSLAGDSPARLLHQQAFFRLSADYYSTVIVLIAAATAVLKFAMAVSMSSTSPAS